MKEHQAVAWIFTLVLFACGMSLTKDFQSDFWKLSLGMFLGMVSGISLFVAYDSKKPKSQGTSLSGSRKPPYPGPYESKYPRKEN